MKLIGNKEISIDYQSYQADEKWDGLKGYITNTSLSKNDVIENYSQLWQIEKAFRISKTDLRIRPVNHRIRNRIEARICNCFAVYAIYKELKRLLKVNRIEISTEKVINTIKEIRQRQYTLPKSREGKTRILNPTPLLAKLLEMNI